MLARSTACLTMALVALATAGGAAAKNVAPPGNAGVQEYQEQVPSASGGEPPQGGRAPSAGGSQQQGSSAAEPGSSGSTSSGTGNSSTNAPSSALSPATRAKLRAKGKDGAAAAKVIDATAPAAADGARGGVAGAHDSAIGAVLHALVGSDGGLGLALPLLILAIAFAGAVVFVRTRHARS